MINKLNQKGFIWTDLIVYGLLISMVVGIGSLVAKGGYELAKFTDNRNKESVLSATFQPTPSPTYTPGPTQQPVVNNQQGANNQAQVTGNGPTRTGKIIKYKEYCKGGQEISVYENEVITKKASDGNTYSMTKDDWICSENAAKNQQNQAGQNNNAQNNNQNGQSGNLVSVPCSVTDKTTPGGTITAPVYGSTVQDAQQQCQSAQSDASRIWKDYTPPKLYTPINCLLDTYCNGSPITYQFDQAACDKMQKSQSDWCQLKQASAKSAQQFNSIPSPTFTPSSPQFQEGFDTGMMCERKFDGYNFIGGCI